MERARAWSRLALYLTVRLLVVALLSLALWVTWDWQAERVVSRQARTRDCNLLADAARRKADTVEVIKVCAQIGAVYSWRQR